MFASVLIANRGEIACRVARTARRLGLRVIAVYSEADAQARHVREADQAYCIGPAPAQESYLRAEAILEVARRSGAECIHPGYGFLSENPDFAEACGGAGVVFVGPPPAAIRAMGLKDAAKRLMTQAGVPVVPGYQGERQEPAFLGEKAREIGYPVLIKAVAGGGGKGMRRVDATAEFLAALAAAKRVAAAAFGDERVLIEKYIEEPRHIEIQVLGDAHGNCVHLFERDCSLQRRHQKVIEEAPAPGLPDGMRRAMGAAAVAAAKAVGYASAGTVEFIVAAGAGLEPRDFHFMEMNTRLQVEHPVTEAITGLDLVEWQFRIAAGEALPFRQDDLAITGHAIEARLYAEDPDAGFLPQTGRLHRLCWPRPDEDLRLDTGVQEGDDITAYYDPMIAKLVVRAATRDQAIARLGHALRHTEILGLRTNLRFLEALLSHDDFVAGAVSTGLIERDLASLLADPRRADVLADAIDLWLKRTTPPASQDVWSSTDGWSLAGLPRRDQLQLVINARPETVTVEHESKGLKLFSTSAGAVRSAGSRAGMLHHFDPRQPALLAARQGFHFEIKAQDLVSRGAEAHSGSAVTRAPMPGRVLRVLIAPGAKVRPGAPLIILEAMKMEHALNAGVEGTVAAVQAAEGAQVKEGDVLCIIEAGGAATP